MQRMAHGFSSPHPAPATESNHDNFSADDAVVPVAESEPVTAPFSFMFRDLPDDALLTPSDTMLEDLARLGASMHYTGNDNDADFNSSTPAGYTYFAQFLDHDITFTEVKKEKPGQTDSELLADENLSPWSKEDIWKKVRNKRTVPLQLESVYGDVSPGQPPPRDGEKFALARVCPHHGQVPGKDEINDLVRSGRSKNPREDRVAFINDPRNDSNLIVSQVHVAFLRAHNAIVDNLGCSFEKAKQILLRHYQWMVYHDILPRFVRDQEIKAAHDNPFCNPSFGVPLEFSAAAFRFGHSLIRTIYYLNACLPRVDLEQMFMLTVLSNGLKADPGKGCLNLPCNAIIQWQTFLEDENKNKARRIRLQMVDPLFKLLNEANVPVSGERRLAVQDLKRGYMLRIPTGQALADKMGVAKLTPDELKATAANPDQLEALNASKFLEKTPLWFYILAEAAKQNVEGDKNINPNATEEAQLNKDKLGPVGGRIVAEAITDFIRRTPGSFLNNGWKPSDYCFTPGKFDIADLLRLAGVFK